MSAVAVMGGCKDVELPLISQSNAAALEHVPKKLPKPSPNQYMYHTLAAEMYRLQGDDDAATLHYERVIEGNQDVALARVATETAAQTPYLGKAIYSAEQWVSIGSDQVEARQYLALLLLRDKQFERAASELNEIHQLIADGDYDALSFLTSLISLESHHDSAFKAFEIYIEKYNDTAIGQLKLARIALDQQKFNDVIARVDKLNNRLSPELADEARVLKSKALYKLGKKEASMQVMQHLVTGAQVDNTSRLEYARLLMLNDNQAGAIEQLEAIYANSPENLEVLKSLVALYIAESKFVEAEKHAKILVQEGAYENLAHHFMAEIHESRNEMDEALHEFRAVEQGEYYSSAQRRISELLVEQYSLEVAKDWLATKRKASDSIDLDFLYWRLEAELLLKYSDNQGAYIAFKNAHKIDADNGQLNYQYAIVAQSVGEIELAERLLLEIIRVKPDNAEALNALGFMLLEKTDRITEASSLIEKAHQLLPDDAAIADSMGWLHFHKGNFQEAAALLFAAYQKTEDPEIASHLIEVLVSQGETKQAKDLLARMMQQYPDDERLKTIQKKIIDI
ncbi:MAG: tetratricopeptide repeat protein [Leucothrix sp.]